MVKHSKALFTLVTKFIPVDLMIHCYAQHRNETFQFKPREISLYKHTLSFFTL